MLSMLFFRSRFSSERLAINGVLRSLLNEDIFVSVLPGGEVLFVTASALDRCSIISMFLRVSAIAFASRIESALEFVSSSGAHVHDFSTSDDLSLLL